MRVHPNPSRYSKEAIPMEENGLLEPSFADAIAAIEQNSKLPPVAADPLGLFAAPDR